MVDHVDPKKEKRGVKHSCPVCEAEYPAPLPFFCSKCGWDFEHDLRSGTHLQGITEDMSARYEQRLQVARKAWRDAQDNCIANEQNAKDHLGSTILITVWNQLHSLSYSGQENAQGEPSNGFTTSLNTVIDSKTGLAWVRDMEVFFDGKHENKSVKGDNRKTVLSRMSWDDAQTFVQDINARRYLGFSDWRLPRVSEVESLIGIPFSVGIDKYVNEFLHLYGFVNLQPNYYWLSDEHVYYKDRAWRVDLFDGSISFMLKENVHYLLLLRTGERRPDNSIK